VTEPHSEHRAEPVAALLVANTGSLGSCAATPGLLLGRAFAAHGVRVPPPCVRKGSCTTAALASTGWLVRANASSAASSAAVTPGASREQASVAAPARCAERDREVAGPGTEYRDPTLRITAIARSRPGAVKSRRAAPVCGALLAARVTSSLFAWACGRAQLAQEFACHSWRCPP